MLLMLEFVALHIFCCADVTALIHCKKCEYNYETEHEMCSQDCVGTLCYYSEYYYTQPERVFTRKGCIVGTPPSLGCRSNQDGQVLCLCDTEYCNRDELVFKTTPTTPLPLKVCKRDLVNGLEPSRRWMNPCAGNFCVFQKSKFALENGTKGYSHSMDCSSGSDFDLFYSQLPFIFYPETCAKLEYGGQPDQTRCYGSMENDTTATYPTDGLVECHADFLSRSLPYIHVTKLCKGQYCIISATPQGDVYRGCMTLDQSKNEVQAIAPGYYQSYNGIEQWVCAASSCNYDLQKMEDSWPEEMAQYKNISQLMIRGLFEELNTTSSTTGALLFVISIFVARFLML